MILTPKKVSKNLKLLVRYFFSGRPKTYYVEKKSSIMRVTARSIWAGMPHIYIYIYIYVYICETWENLLSNLWRRNKYRSTCTSRIQFISIQWWKETMVSRYTTVFDLQPVKLISNSSSRVIKYNTMHSLWSRVLSIFPFLFHLVSL